MSEHEPNNLNGDRADRILGRLGGGFITAGGLLLDVVGIDAIVNEPRAQGVLALAVGVVATAEGASVLSHRTGPIGYLYSRLTHT